MWRGGWQWGGEGGCSRCSLKNVPSDVPLFSAGEAMQAALALVLVCLALGIFAPLAAAVAAAAFSLGCTRFDPDCPTQPCLSGVHTLL